MATPDSKAFQADNWLLTESLIATPNGWLGLQVGFQPGSLLAVVASHRPAERGPKATGLRYKWVLVVQ